MHRLVKTAAIVYATCSFGSASEVISAQQAKPAFEVVSIRKNLDRGPTIGGSRGDTFRMTSTSVRNLISWAYHDEILWEDHVVGGPSWLETDRFDVSAKPVGVSINETRMMMRSVLAERFGLVMVKEQRQGDVYVLKTARGDGRPNPDLRRVGDDCVTKPKDPASPLQAVRPSSGARPSYASRCATLDTVASYLSKEVGTTVINETGITGRWDFVIAHSGMQPRIGPDGLAVDDRPMLLSAVQEQLGLKLERRRGLVDVWVIKSVHPPTEN